MVIHGILGTYIMNEKERENIEKRTRAILKKWRIKEEDIEDYLQEAYLAALLYTDEKEEIRHLQRFYKKRETRMKKEKLRKNIF